MNEHDFTEMAYRNGFDDGYRKAIDDMVKYLLKKEKDVNDGQGTVFNKRGVHQLVL